MTRLGEHEDARQCVEGNHEESLSFTNRVLRRRLLQADIIVGPDASAAGEFVDQGFVLEHELDNLQKGVIAQVEEPRKDLRSLVLIAGMEFFELANLYAHQTTPLLRSALSATGLGQTDSSGIRRMDPD